MKHLAWMVFTGTQFSICPWTNMALFPGSFHFIGESIYNDDTVLTIQVVTCEESGPGKYRLLYADRWYGRCVLNGSCSWPTGGVDGMVWSALLSVNETRQSPAEQLQPLMETWDDPEEHAAVGERPEKRRRRGEGGEVQHFSLSQRLMIANAPWCDLHCLFWLSGFLPLAKCVTSSLTQLSESLWAKTLWPMTPSILYCFEVHLCC